ncbi:MAG: acyl carrier protein [Syntrophobacteraceae bacterium]|nr:acyl carrier protein [Syntrophobacteraceae bacterium]
MEARFINMLCEVLERDLPIDFDDSLDELQEWDSLAALSLISMVDEEYGINIGSKDFENINTVGDIYKCIQTKLDHRQ